MKVILGSQSPRRKEILGYFSLPFTQVTPPFDEASVPFEGDPEKYVIAISKGKAASIAPHFPDNIILTADTIVFHEGKIFGKPKDYAEAQHHFNELSGKGHKVYSGVTVQKGLKSYSQAECTKVFINKLTPEQIAHYLKHKEWADKAGSYAIQMAGGLIVNRIEGCYYNVMGFPINTVEQLLKKVGLELWDYL